MLDGKVFHIAIERLTNRYLSISMRTVATSNLYGLPLVAMASVLAMSLSFNLHTYPFCKMLYNVTRSATILRRSRLSAFNSSNLLQ